MTTPNQNKKLTLHLLNEKFTMSKLAQFAEFPMIVAKGEMCFSARTDDEFIIITPEFMAPTNVQQEIGWRALRVDGESALKDGSILPSLIDPLTQVGLNPLVFTTFTTVYVFLREEKIVDAVKALQRAGHSFEHKEVAVPK
ncbi:MAG: ACT domain-containing protein [Ignavibacteriales bacterium]|nr:ACT domain-containing protein [Ignavibacteriales bacterium]